MSLTLYLYTPIDLPSYPDTCNKITQDICIIIYDGGTHSISKDITECTPNLEMTRLVTFFLFLSFLNEKWKSFRYCWFLPNIIPHKLKENIY